MIEERKEDPSEILLQRVLEVVDSFFRILQTIVLEDCLVHVSISNESALEERSSLAIVMKVVQSSTSSSYLSQPTFASYNGGRMTLLLDLRGKPLRYHN